LFTGPVPTAAPPAARDNNAQGGVDVLQALRVAAGTFDLPTVGSTTFDPANVFYFGHSQGSNVGIPAIAYADGVKGSIFSGAGSYLIEALLTKTSPVNAKVGLEFLLGEPLASDHPVMQIWQTYFERVDTANFAPLLVTSPPTAPQNVLVTWGTDDTYSPNPTINNTCEAAGFPVAGTPIENIDTGTVARPITQSACFQYTSGDYDGHFVAQRHADAIADWTAFITSLIAGDAISIP
jgi:hypothetical protein